MNFWPASLPASGKLQALLLAAFLATFDVSGISLIREILDAALVIAALFEVKEQRKALARIFLNPVMLTVLLFVLVVLASCWYSPLARVSFGEAKTPILKGMLLLPPAFALVALSLARRGWRVEQISALLLTAFACSALSQVLWVLGSYLQHWLAFGSLPADAYFHRYKIGALLIPLPFALTMMLATSGRKAVFWAGINALLIVAIVTSNSRGAWLGMFAAMAYLGFIQRRSLLGWIRDNRLATALAVIGTLLMLGILAGTTMVETVSTRIASGLDSNARYGNGVWGATLDMIRIRPWLGYGYGDQVYFDAYNALAPQHPEWTLRSSIGPHNALLGHWAAAGVFGLLSLLALYSGLIRGIAQSLRQSGDCRWTRNLLHACFATVLSYYLVRGQFEIVRWNAYGLIVALLLWLYAVPATAQAGDNAGKESGCGSAATT